MLLRYYASALFLCLRTLPGVLTVGSPFRITGTPLAQTTYHLTFKVTDALGGTDEQPLPLTIN